MNIRMHRHLRRSAGALFMKMEVLGVAHFCEEVLHLITRQRFIELKFSSQQKYQGDRDRVFFFFTDLIHHVVMTSHNACSYKCDKKVCTVYPPTRHTPFKAKWVVALFRICTQ